MELGKLCPAQTSSLLVVVAIGNMPEIALTQGYGLLELAKRGKLQRALDAVMLGLLWRCIPSFPTQHEVALDCVGTGTSCLGGPRQGRIVDSAVAGGCVWAEHVCPQPTGATLPLQADAPATVQV